MASESAGTPPVVIRPFRKGDEAIIPAIMEKSFGNLELIPRVKYSVGGPYFSPEGSFIAEKNGEAVGCIGLVKLPRTNWFELKYLGVIPDGLSPTTADKLLDLSIHTAESKGVERLKASTPAVQPYFDLYKKKGFEPARRQLQVGWDLTKEPEPALDSVQTKELEKDMAAEARHVWVANLRPYWVWVD
ncbi:MAG TPA: GNAT family N-acetyltransferase [Nitrososphaerales archaeon]|nr:GNAT family N-acetyltransferase [Nitrososphaerales archaeon]